MNKGKIKKCPYCQSDSGYYTKDRISGTSIYYHGFNNEDVDNGSMYEFLTHKTGKNAYCGNCEKYLGKSKDMEVSNE